jgi:hypothetical protein
MCGIRTSIVRQSGDALGVDRAVHGAGLRGVEGVGASRVAEASGDIDRKGLGTQQVWCAIRARSRTRVRVSSPLAVIGGAAAVASAAAAASIVGSMTYRHPRSNS